MVWLDKLNFYSMQFIYKTNFLKLLLNQFDISWNLGRSIVDGMIALKFIEYLTEIIIF